MIWPWPNASRGQIGGFKNPSVRSGPFVFAGGIAIGDDLLLAQEFKRKTTQICWINQ